MVVALSPSTFSIPPSLDKSLSEQASSPEERGMIWPLEAVQKTTDNTSAVVSPLLPPSPRPLLYAIAFAVSSC